MTRRLTVGLFCALLCSSGLTYSSDAEARPRRHHYSSYHQSHHVQHHRKHRKHKIRYKRRAAPVVAAPSFADSFFTRGFSSETGLVAEARRHLGQGAVFGRATLWCARFMNVMLRNTGHSGTGSDMAASFANYGQRVSGPQVGAIAVMSRGRRGGHVGVVSAVNADGTVRVISGNHNRRVAESNYPARRIYAYVMPR